MIITEQKSFEEIRRSLEPYDKVFVVGCASCATAWHTGGEPEVKEMIPRLEGEGKTCTGWVVMDVPCDERVARREIRAHAAEIAQAEALLVMSCGAGVQTVALSLEEKPVLPALNALYLARLQRLTKSDERCVLCGECVLAMTGGLCPLTLCPKELLNGPCGGYRHGKCEVDLEKECAWVEIYKRLKRFDQMEKLYTIQLPKDQSKRTHPRRVEKVIA